MSKRRPPPRESPDIDFSPAGGGEEIQITFDFEDARPDHFHGIRMLLQHSLASLPRMDSAVSALADMCSSDKAHGTVITAEGDDEVFAFAAAVDLTSDKVRARTPHANRALHDSQSLSLALDRTCPWSGKFVKRCWRAPPKVPPARVFAVSSTRNHPRY